MKKILFLIGLFCGILASSSSIYSLEKVNSATNTTNLLEIEAESLYQNDRYESSIDRLKAAIEQYQKLKDTIGEINARINLALVYQKTDN